MAQEVGHYKEVSEGPFVICNPYGKGWRIEMDIKGVDYTVMPSLSVHKLMCKLGLNAKTYRTYDRELIVRICDTLNERVKEGSIVLLEGDTWVNETI